MQINSAVRYLPDVQIESAAEALLARYRREIDPIDSFPVPVERIADLLLQLQIDWTPIPDTDAEPILARIVPSFRLLQLNDNRRAFFDQYQGSRAYSIAHEIGHHELHLVEGQLELTELADGSVPAFLCRGVVQERPPREWQAERFAAYLVMPADLLEPVLSRLDLLQWRTLYELRDYLGVSITALIKRLEDLGRIYVDRDRKLYRSQAEAAGQLALF